MIVEWATSLWQDFLGKSPTEQIEWLLTVGGPIAAAAAAVVIFLLRFRPKSSPPNVDRATADIILAAAKKAAPLTYGQLLASVRNRQAGLAKTDMENIINSLTTLSHKALRHAESREKWLPPFTAIVVSASDGLPGKGFNSWAQRHYGLLGPKEKGERLASLKLHPAQEIAALQADVYANADEFAAIFRDLGA